MSSRVRPVGVSFVALFFVFGAVMASLALVMVLFPGSILEPLWRLNPHAHEGFASMGWWAVLLMLIVVSACASAAAGLWRCARSGYITAVLVLTINLLGDTLNAFIGHDWRTLVGLPIGGAIILYLIRNRKVFA